MRDGEKLKANWKKYSSKPEVKARRAELARERRKANPEHFRNLDKTYRDSNKEACSERTKDWRSRSKEHLLEYERKRYKENPEYYIAKSGRAKKNRRARMKGAEGHWTEADIFRLLVDQKGLCVGCGDYIADCYEIDHNVPLAKSGSNWPYNLQLLCRSCNAQKNDRTMEKWYGELRASRPL